MSLEKVRKAMDDLGEEVVKELINQLLKADKDATGKLIRSIDYKLIEAANEFIIEVSSEDYLKYIDEGRRKGAKQPPTSAIIPWVKAKNIKVKGAKTPEQTAFVIARSISRNGIKPTHVIRKTIDTIYSNKMALLEKAAIEDIEVMLEKIKFS